MGRVRAGCFEGASQGRQWVNLGWAMVGLVSRASRYGKPGKERGWPSTGRL